MDNKTHVEMRRRIVLDNKSFTKHGVKTRQSKTVHWSYLAPPLEGEQGIDVRVMTQKRVDGKIEITLSPDHIISMLVGHTMFMDEATHSTDSDGLTLKPVFHENKNDLKKIRELNQWNSIRLKENVQTFKCWFCYNTQEVTNVTGDKLKDLKELTNIPLNEPKICKNGCEKSESVIEAIEGGEE